MRSADRSSGDSRHAVSQALGMIPKATTRDELVLLAPAISVLVLVSSQTGFSRYMRYVLPMAPYIFVRVGALAKHAGARSGLFTCATFAMLGWSAFSSLRCFPHTLSYFNELAGGPKGGPAHLIDAQVDWGQDLLRLKRWYDEHTEARPLAIAYFGSLNAAIIGVDFTIPPEAPESANDLSHTASPPDGLAAGWYAISVNLVYGNPGYSYFRRFRPVSMAGYSIYIYHLSSEEIECARSRAREIRGA